VYWSGRVVKIAFADETLENAFKELRTKRFEERRLAEFLDRAMDDLKQNPFCGLRIPGRQWPKEYVRKHRISNLWKYDLPNAWRLLYTVKGNELEIVAILLEWLNHKNYEKRFGYRNK